MSVKQINEQKSLLFEFQFLDIAIFWVEWEGGGAVKEMRNLRCQAKNFIFLKYEKYFLYPYVSMPNTSHNTQRKRHFFLILSLINFILSLKRFLSFYFSTLLLEM